MPVAIVANAIWFLNYVLSLRGRRVNQMTDEGELDLPAKASAEKQDPCPDASEIDTETFVEKCSETPERGVLSLTSQDSTSSELESTPLAPDQELDGDASSKPSSAIEEEEPSSLNHLEDSKATCTDVDTLADVKNTKDGEEEVEPPQIKDTDETCTDREAVEEKLTCDVAEKEQLHLEDSKATCTTSSEDVAETKEREDPAEEEEPQCDVTEEAGMTLLKDSEESCKDGEASATSTSSISKEEEPFYLDHSKATCTAMDISADLTAETKDRESPVEEEVNPQCDVTEETGMTALESVDESCTDGESGSTSTASITIEEEEPSSQLHLQDSKATCTAMDTSSADVAEMNERDSPVEEEVKPLCDVTEEAKMNVVEDTEELSTDGEARSTSTASSAFEEEEPSSQLHLGDSKASASCTAKDTSSADVPETSERESPVEEEAKPQCDVIVEVGISLLENTEESITDGEAGSTSTASSTIEEEEPSSQLHLEDSKATCIGIDTSADVTETERENTVEEDVKPPLCETTEEAVLEDNDESCKDGEASCTSTSSTIKEEEPSSLHHLVDSKTTCTGMDTLTDVKNTITFDREEEVKPPQFEDTDKICTDREAVEEVNCDVTEEAVLDKSCTDGEERSTSTSSTTEVEEPSSLNHLKDSKSSCTALALVDVSEAKMREDEAGMTALESVDESCRDGSTSTASITIEEEEPSSQLHLQDSKATCTTTSADVGETKEKDPAEEKEPQCDVTEEVGMTALQASEESCKDGEASSTSTSSKATCTAMDTLADVKNTISAKNREKEIKPPQFNDADKTCADGEAVEEVVKCDVTEEARMTALAGYCRDGESTASSAIEEEPFPQLHLEDSKSTCTALALDISVDVRETKEREDLAEEEVNPPQIMCDVTEKPRDEDPSNPVEQRLYRCTVNVPRTCVGRLIGKNGRNIKTVMNRTGTNISILQRKAKPEDSSIPCRIQGSWIDIRTATELIRAMFPAIPSPNKRPKLIKKLSGH